MAHSNHLDDEVVVRDSFEWVLSVESSGTEPPYSHIGSYGSSGMMAHNDEQLLPNQDDPRDAWEVFGDRYTFQRVLGGGTFGDVW